LTFGAEGYKIDAKGSDVNLGDVMDITPSDMTQEKDQGEEVRIIFRTSRRYRRIAHIVARRNGFDGLTAMLIHLLRRDYGAQMIEELGQQNAAEFGAKKLISDAEKQAFLNGDL
jgi:hypothetical protein